MIDKPWAVNSAITARDIVDFTLPKEPLSPELLERMTPLALEAMACLDTPVTTELLPVVMQALIVYAKPDQLIELISTMALLNDVSQDEIVAAYGARKVELR